MIAYLYSITAKNGCSLAGSSVGWLAGSFCLFVCLTVLVVCLFGQKVHRPTFRIVFSEESHKQYFYGKWEMNSESERQWFVANPRDIWHQLQSGFHPARQRVQYFCLLSVIYTHLSLTFLRFESITTWVMDNTVNLVVPDSPAVQKNCKRDTLLIPFSIR